MKVETHPSVTISGPSVCPSCQPPSEGFGCSDAHSPPVQMELVSYHQPKQTVSVDDPLMALNSLLILSLPRLFNWILGAQSSALMWVIAFVPHLLLDKGSVVIFKVIISLTTG